LFNVIQKQLFFLVRQWQIGWQPGFNIAPIVIYPVDIPFNLAGHGVDDEHRLVGIGLLALQVK